MLNWILAIFAICLASFNLFENEPRPIVKQTLQRIVAVGDFHGDAPNTLQVLKLAKLINDNNTWIGESTIFVQTVKQPFKLIRRGTLLTEVQTLENSINSYKSY
jgi:hypothetical protein